MEIKKFVLEIDGSTGETLNCINLDMLTANERNEILYLVFSQGLERLGYSPKLKEVWPC